MRENYDIEEYVSTNTVKAESFLLCQSAEMVVLPAHHWLVDMHAISAQVRQWQGFDVSCHVLSI